MTTSPPEPSANSISEEARERLSALGDTYRSVGAIGGAALIASVLMLIALPGVRGVPSESLIGSMLAVVLFGVWGVAVGAIGRWLCLHPTPARLRRLGLVAALAAVHLPFGTWAAVHTLWVRWRLAARSRASPG